MRHKHENSFPFHFSLPRFLRVRWLQATPALFMVLATSSAAGSGVPQARYAVGLSAVEAMAAMEKGELTSTQYVEILIDRIQTYPEINAFIHLEEAAARAAAEQADALRAAGELTGPLHGLPVVIKDSINVAGMPTTAGTPGLSGYVPAAHSPAVQALIDAGAIILGKTNLHELSAGFTTTNLFTGATLNPYDFNRIPGGSSGGNSAALAARFAPLALGEDTLGSTRVPAALTGTTGLRPTTGRYAINGVVPITLSLDVLGPMARNVEDLILADGVITGDLDQPTPVGLAELRLGVPASHFRDRLDPVVARAFNMALRRLRQAGATLVEVDLPGAGEASQQAWQAIAFYEAPIALATFLAESGSGISPEQLIGSIASPDVAALFEFAAENPVPDEIYLQVVNELVPMLQFLYTAYLDGHNLDAMIYPTTILPAALIGEHAVSVGGDTVTLLEAYSHNTHYAPVVGAPAVTVPLGQHEANLPVGAIDIAGRPWDDRRVLAIARAVEAELLPIRPPVQIRPMP